MPNWGAEIPVTIVDRKPDFVGDRDACAVFDDGLWYELNHNGVKCWNWHPGITKIRLSADHPYYTKEKPMVISREAAIEALRRSKDPVNESKIAEVLSGQIPNCRELAKAIQRLWDLCPSERPVDNRVIAMHRALVNIQGGDQWTVGDVGDLLAEFDGQLAELEGGK